MNKILIVGAGTAGVSLAVSLQAYGYEPEIIDSTPSLKTSAYAVTLLPRGLQVLESLAVLGAVEQHGSRIESCNIRSSKATKLRSFTFDKNVPLITIARSDLQTILIEKLRHPIHYGLTITNIEEQTQGVLVRFSDDRQELFQLVVGADGINSVVRSLLFPAYQPRRVEAGIWAGLISHAEAPMNIHTADITVGHRKFIGMFPNARGVTTMASALFPSNTDIQQVDTVALFAPLSAIQSAVTSQFTYSSHIREIKLPSWGSGRVILIGDAAHASVPATAMGSSSALCDASALAATIRDTPHPEWTNILASYQHRRKRAATISQRLALVAGHILLIGFPFTTARNILIRFLPSRLLYYVLRYA